MINVAFLLSANSNFHSYYGGATDRWVHEVTSRATTFKYTIVAHQTIENNSYQKSHIGKRIISFNFKKRTTLAAYIWCFKNISILKRNDIIVIENRPEYTLVLRRLGYKGRLILHVHNDVFEHYSLAFLKKIEAATDCIVACCHAIVTHLRTRLPVMYKKCAVVYNGVDAQIFKPVERKNVEGYKILFVGRIDQNKGLLFFLECIEILYDTFPNIEVHIAGNNGFGSFKSKYEELVENRIAFMSKRMKIVNHGYVDHDTELPKLFSDMTLFCLPSTQTEAFPLVVLEAMFCKTMVLASDLGGVREVVSREECLFQAGNKVDFIDKASKILAEPDLRHRCIEAHYDAVRQRFQWSKITTDFEEVVNEA